MCDGFTRDMSAMRIIFIQLHRNAFGSTYIEVLCQRGVCEDEDLVLLAVVLQCN